MTPALGRPKIAVAKLSTGKQSARSTP